MADRDWISAHVFYSDGLDRLLTEAVRPLVGYRPEHDRYGTGDCLHVVEEHFADSSQIALALVSAGASPAARETAGFCAAILAMLLRRRDAGAGTPAGNPPARQADRHLH